MSASATDYRIGNGTDQTVNLTSNIDTGTGFYALGWGGATGIVNVNSCNLIVGGNLIVGHEANSRGELYLNSGTINANSSVDKTRTIIANNQNSTGIVVVNGGTLTAIRELSVGENGTGTLTITNSGTVYAKNSLHLGKNASAKGTVNLIGGSLWVTNDINVANGTGSAGTLNGSSATLRQLGSGNVFNVGYGQNSSGTVVKDGGDWSCTYLRIATGYGSTGSFVQNGGTMAATKEFSIGLGENSTGSFTLNGGTLSLSDFNPNIGNGTNSKADFNIAGGTVTLMGNYFLTVGRKTGSTATMTVGPGGKYTSTGNNVWGLLVGWDAPGTLNIAGGEVETRILSLCNTVNAANSEVNITDGGVLAIDYVKYTSNTRNTKVNFDGGKMKRRTQSGVSNTFFDANANVTVSVGANGAEFDANGYDIAINEALEDKSGEAGNVRFCGGGSITLGGANTYTGGTKVELGTKIIATTADAKNAVLGNLVVTGVAVDGDYYVFEYSGLADGDLANVTCPGGAAGTTITREGDQIKVHYVAPAVELAWNGGDAAWATADAWTNETGTATTWSDGNCAVFENASTVTLGANAAAISATFNAGATVAAGGGTLTVPTVTVAEGVSATINAPVSGALTKIGAGTLTLGASRADATTLAEGTLAMSGAASLDWSQLTLGTDAAKPVTLHLTDGAVIANVSADILLPGEADRSVTLVKDSGDWNLGNRGIRLCNYANTTAAFFHNGGSLTSSGSIMLNGTSSMAASNSTITIGGDFNVANDSGANCTFNADSTALTLTSQGNVFNVGLGANSTGTVVKDGGDWSCYYLRIGLGSGSTGVFTHNSGTMEVKAKSSGSASEIVIGYAGTGIFTLNGGNVTFSSGINQYIGMASGSSGTLNLNGGTLMARCLRRNNNGATATVNFNGGTLKANYADDRGLIAAGVGINVLADGGTIDAAAQDVTVKESIGGTGGMKYVGGGSVTLASGCTYTGATTVEVGTTLVVPSAIAGGDKLAFTIPAGLADGVYTVVRISGDSQFADDTLTGAALPVDANAQFRLSGDRKSILCIYGNPGFVWVGGASGDLSNAANWANGSVPGAGDYCTIASATPAAFTVGDTFTPASITFPADTAAITISGNAISGILAITNLSTSVSATFLSPVSFAEGRAIEVYYTATYADTLSYGNVNGMVWFKGGVTGYDVRQNAGSGRSNIFAGEYRRTTTASDFKATQGGTYRNVVYKNSSLTVDTATDIWELGIDNGGAFTTRVATVRDDGTYSRLSWRNDGEIVVTEELLITATGDNAGYLSLTADSAKGNIYKAEKLTIAGNNWVRLSNKSSAVNTTTVFVGDDGIVFNDSGSRFSTGALGTQNGTTTIRPWHGDFAIGERSGNAHSIAINKNAVFNTDNEAGEGRRITVNATIDNSCSVSIAGSGVVRYNRVNGNSGALSVGGTATLELGAGAKTGTGAVTIGGNATLSVPEEGTGTVGGNLMLASGSVLSFKLDRDNETTLSLASAPTLPSDSGTVAVKFAEGSVFTPGKTYTLISGGVLSDGNEAKFSLPEAVKGKLDVVSGNLVYDAPKYFYIKIR